MICINCGKSGARAGYEAVSQDRETFRGATDGILEGFERETSNGFTSGRGAAGSTVGDQHGSCS